MTPLGPLSPLTKHSVTDGHATEARVAPISDVDDQVFPPSVVDRMMTPVELLVPTAVHANVVGQAMPFTFITPAGTFSDVQVTPPSVVARMKLVSPSL
jgi:hypothetical protein